MSDFLYARPSFLSGVARTLDISGGFDEYNDSPDEATADAVAMLADWRAAGFSISESLRRELASYCARAEGLAHRS